MNKTAVINIVGLSKRVLEKNMTPFLSGWIKKNTISTIEPVLPAVTCSAQSTYLTGKWPKDHGIVGNGWYFKDEREVKLWRQSNKLVQAEKVWDLARQKNPAFTCANMFWWYNMYSTVDYSCTPRPQYLADGRKKPDCYTQPADLRDRLQNELGIFPLFDFWGPKTSIKSSKWISEASKRVFEWHSPTLTLVYLPHLDYCLQKHGHDSELVKKDLLEIDGVCKDLVAFFERNNVKVVLLSEYGITDTNNPVHINRILRKHNLLAIRNEGGLELLDAGASKVFALSDHQVAHLYFNDPGVIPQVKDILSSTNGIEEVLDEAGKSKYHIDHPRAGDLIAIADANSWFTYYYWMDDKKAPDFARTVDIHKKPGYDPVEMFFNPKTKLLMPKIVLKLLKKKMGFRTLMDFIPLDANLVKGSHGRVHVKGKNKPVFIANSSPSENLQPTQICELILKSIFDK